MAGGPQTLSRACKPNCSSVTLIFIFISSWAVADMLNAIHQQVCCILEGAASPAQLKLSVAMLKQRFNAAKLALGVRNTVALDLNLLQQQVWYSCSCPRVLHKLPAISCSRAIAGQSAQFVGSCMARQSTKG